MRHSQYEGNDERCDMDESWGEPGRDNQDLRRSDIDRQGCPRCRQIDDATPGLDDAVSKALIN